MSAANVSMRICWLVPSRSVEVDHRQLRGPAQHRHDDFVVAQVFGHRDDPLDHRFAADPTGRDRVQRADNPRGEQCREHRPDVGPAPIDRRPADPRAARDLRQSHSLDPVSGHTIGRCLEDAVADRRRGVVTD